MADTTTILSGLSFSGIVIGLLVRWRFAIIPLVEFFITFVKSPFKQKQEIVKQAAKEPTSDGAIEIVIGDFKLVRQPSQQNIRRLSTHVEVSDIETETL